MKIDKRLIMKFLPVVLFFVAVGVVMLFIKFNHKPVDTSTLPKYDSPISCVVIESSDDINGGYSKITVNREDDKAIISSAFVEKADYPEKDEKYTVSTEVLDKIEELFYENGMIEWDKNEDRKHASSDTVGYILTFCFGEEKTSFSSLKIPNRNNSLSDIFSIIETYEKNENSDVVLKDVFNEDGLNIFSFKNGYLDAEIVNNEDYDKEFSSLCKLFRSENGEWQPVSLCYDGEYFTYSVPAGSSISVKFNLNYGGKLKAGEYKIVCDSVNAEFSIE